ncbi:hypothetical protein RvY_13355 [Ramazzottius varieornatus]|uniref:Uncharacterized protein n=1 Tax=Ramazzottius varieornatus TaxID=947166 RepID=A0A1D1VMJ4_RAMVA|nr:hypothetical protein RvY_13355 [Ramazzottius varieornatus]
MGDWQPKATFSFLSELSLLTGRLTAGLAAPPRSRTPCGRRHKTAFQFKRSDAGIRRHDKANGVHGMLMTSPVTSLAKTNHFTSRISDDRTVCLHWLKMPESTPSSPNLTEQLID